MPSFSARLEKVFAAGANHIATISHLCRLRLKTWSNDWMLPQSETARRLFMLALRAGFESRKKSALFYAMDHSH